MSEQGTAAVADAVNAETESGPQKLMSAYEKKEKVILLAGENADDFLSFTQLFDETNPLTDWTGQAPDTFKTLAVVQSEDGTNRLIAIPDMETAFADETVKRFLYRKLVNHITHVASSNDASAAQFITPAGTLKQKFDLDAFKFQARALVKLLRGQGLAGITVGNLKNAFANSAFAAVTFPRVAKETWEKILGVVRAKAEQHGYDVAIFDHWGATRDARTDSGEEFSLDFDELGSELDAETSDAKDEAEQAKAS